MPAPHGNVPVDVDLITVGSNPIEQGVCNSAAAKLRMPAGNGNLGTENGGGMKFRKMARSASVQTLKASKRESETL